MLLQHDVELMQGRASTLNQSHPSFCSAGSPRESRPASMSGWSAGTAVPRMPCTSAATWSTMYCGCGAAAALPPAAGEVLVPCLVR